LDSSDKKEFDWSKEPSVSPGIWKSESVNQSLMESLYTILINAAIFLYLEEIDLQNCYLNIESFTNKKIETWWFDYLDFQPSDFLEIDNFSLFRFSIFTLVKIKQISSLNRQGKVLCFDLRSKIISKIERFQFKNQIWKIISSSIWFSLSKPSKKLAKYQKLEAEEISSIRDIHSEELLLSHTDHK
jgi:hypothetical protein